MRVYGISEVKNNLHLFCNELPSLWNSSDY